MSSGAPHERLHLGRVIETTFDVIYRDARILVPLALLLVGLPSAILGWLQIAFDGDASAGNAATLITQSLLQGAVMHTVAANLNRQPRSFQGALNKAGQLFRPLAAIGILSTLGLILGFLLLIVPGVILACMWAVAAPARVAEGPGVFRAFTRSRILTKGYRGKIALLFLAYLVALVVLSAFLGLTGIVGGDFFINVVISPILEAFASLLVTAGAASLYYELRRIKEGAGPESLADVFA